MNYLITGFPGSGKSTVADELEKRGYAAYNTDDIPGISYFVDRTTKKPVSVPKNASSDWKLKHDWAWNPDKIQALLNNIKDVYIGAISSNQADFYDQFEKIFVLTIDEPTMRQRLASRSSENNIFGKNPNELAHLLKIREEVQKQLLDNKKAIAIDATQSLEKVINTILSYTK